MRTHLLCALALGLAATATAAAAQDSDTITINTTVTPFCQGIASNPGPMALGALSDGVGMVVTSFAGPSTAQINGYYCNAPATVTLSATPLTQTANSAILDPSSFTNRIDYDASLTWDNVSGSVNSADAPVEIESAEANIGNLVISVSGPDTEGNKRPIAGDYSGAVTLTVTLDN